LRSTPVQYCLGRLLRAAKYLRSRRRWWCSHRGAAGNSGATEVGTATDRSNGGMCVWGGAASAAPLRLQLLEPVRPGRQLAAHPGAARLGVRLGDCCGDKAVAEGGGGIAEESGRGSWGACSVEGCKAVWPRSGLHRCTFLGSRESRIVGVPLPTHAAALRGQVRACSAGGAHRLGAPAAMAVAAGLAVAAAGWAVTGRGTFGQRAGASVGCRTAAAAVPEWAGWHQEPPNSHSCYAASPVHNNQHPPVRRHLADVGQRRPALHQLPAVLALGTGGRRQVAGLAGLRRHRAIPQVCVIGAKACRRHAVDVTPHLVRRLPGPARQQASSCWQEGRWALLRSAAAAGAGQLAEAAAQPPHPALEAGNMNAMQEPPHQWV
jgi:hypothetical protein